MKNPYDVTSVFKKSMASLDMSTGHVNTPTGYAADANHYQRLSEQPIEIMQKLFTAEQLKGFLLGNVIKYALRCGLKDNPVKEAQKIAQYTAWYIDVAEGRKIDPRKIYIDGTALLVNGTLRHELENENKELKKIIKEMISAIANSNFCEVCGEEFGKISCDECPWGVARERGEEWTEDVE